MTATGAAGGAASATAQSPDNPRVFSISALRLLIVDDDEVDRAAVRRGLSRSDPDIRCAEAVTAAETVRALEDATFDCVLLDFNLPDGDGLALLRRIRELQPDTAVVMLTGQGDEETAVRLMKAGASDYISKHALSPERLVQSVRYAVTLARAQADARRAQDVLRATEERLRLATDSAAIGTWEYNPLTKAVIWDERAYEIFGYPVGAAVDDAHFFARVPEEDAAQLRLTLKRALDPDGDGLFQLEYRIRDAAPESELRWLDVRGRVLFDGAAGKRRAVRFLGTVADITDRKRAEEALREETQLVEMLQRIGSTLTAELDSKRVVQTVTDACTSLIGAEFGAFFYNVTNDAGESYMLYAISGVPREAFSKFPMPRNTAVFAPTFRGEATVRIDDVRTDQRYGRNPPYHGMPEGHLPVVSYLAVPVVSHSGTVHGGLFFGHGRAGVFTARHERLVTGVAHWAAVAMDNAHLFEAAQRSREEAERANHAKSEFLAAMSHDLRTPLNAIGGYAQLVEDGVYGEPTEGQRISMQRVRRAQEHLLSLINNVLHFARIEAGQIEVDPTAIPIHETLSGVQVLIEPQLAARKLSFRYVPGPGDVAVLADHDRLMQVLLNLLTNAVKFTDTGGITVTWDADETTVRIHVSDTGRGIPPDRIDTIFDPFVQAAATRAERSDGVGLGLSISRDLARAMGGNVEVVSRLGEGSTFTVTLPRAAAQL